MKKFLLPIAASTSLAPYRHNKRGMDISTSGPMPSDRYNELYLKKAIKNDEDQSKLLKTKTGIQNVWKKKKVIFGLLIVVLFLIGMLFTESFLMQVGRFLSFESPLAPADVIVVLSGSLYDRTDKAIELYQQGYSEKILLTQPLDLPADLSVIDGIKNEYAINRALFEHHAISSEAISYGSSVCLSTYEEAVNIRKWMMDRSFQSAIVITGYFHARRSKWIFEHVFQDTEMNISIVPAVEEGYTAEDWWKSEKGFILVQNEILKASFRLFSN